MLDKDSLKYLRYLNLLQRFERFNIENRAKILQAGFYWYDEQKALKRKRKEKKE